MESGFLKKGEKLNDITSLVMQKSQTHDDLLYVRSTLNINANNIVYRGILQGLIIPIQ